VYAIRRDVPTEIPSSPLIVTFHSGTGSAVQVKVAHRDTGVPLGVGSVTLAIGQSMNIPVRGTTYRITLLSTNRQLFGVISARIRVSQVFAR
jgi:hypothetical protein